MSPSKTVTTNQILTQNRGWTCTWEHIENGPLIWHVD